MNVNSNSPTLLHVTARKHQSCPLFLRMSERDGEVLFVFCVEESLNQKNIRAGKKKQISQILSLALGALKEREYILEKIK